MEIIMVLLAIAIIIFIVIKSNLNQYDKETKILEDPDTPFHIKKQIQEKREKEEQIAKVVILRHSMRRNNLIQDCKLENIYGTFKNNTSDITHIGIYDDYIAYEKYNGNNKPIVHFTISYDKIIDAKCDTTEKLTAMRVIGLGIMAFAFKKKTYYTIITYKDDLTNSDQQLIFRVTNPVNKDEFINNLLIKRNQYLMQHKKTV